MILETLPFSFEMAKKILKDYRVFKWKSMVLQILLPRRRRTIPNKESSRERIREQTQGQVLPLWPFRTLAKECPVHLKEKGKYTSFSHYWIFSGRFHHLWWIDSRPTICKLLWDIQQVRRLNNGIILTLTSNVRLVMQVSER